MQLHDVQGGATFRALNAAGSGRMEVSITDAGIEVRQRGKLLLHAKAARGPRCRLFAAEWHGDGDCLSAATSAALEALLASDAAIEAVELATDSFSPLTSDWLRQGLAVMENSALVVLPDLFWQAPALWLACPQPAAYPQHLTISGGKRHPRRPPKPSGEVYARHIPWLGQTVSFRALDPDRDLERFHRWMNDPRVAEFWNEDGDLDKHRAYLGNLMADPHMLPLIGCFDGVPFGYFELYWAKENRIAPFYDADDYDRGWHVVVGEDAYRGRQWLTAWLPSLMHYMFLDDCRTQRIVGEPRADHHQQIRNLERSGFANLKQFDFPHKRATLVMLLRERFFGERLWVPRATPDAEHRPDAAVRARVGQAIPIPA